MWTFVGFCILLLLTIVTYRSGGSLLWPPALFAMVWTMVMFGILISPVDFYPLSLITVTIYVIGCLSVMLGGMIAGQVRIDTGPRWDPTASGTQATMNRFLNVSLAGLILLFPLFLKRMAELTGTTGILESYAQMRLATLDVANTPGGGAFSFTDNLPILSSIVALIAMNENARTGRNGFIAWAIFVVSMVYQVLTAARTGVFLLVVSAAVLMFFHGRRVIAAIGFGAILFFAVSAFNVIVLKKGADKSSMSILESAQSIGEEMLINGLGGAVAFDQIANRPDIIPPNQRITHFFEHTLNKLGGHFDEPPIHAEYLEPVRGIQMNVYTAYFCYYPMFGFPGVVICCALIGFALSLFYRMGRAGSQIGTILYTVGAAYLAFTSIADAFFMVLNFWLKLALFGSAAYYFCSRPRTVDESLHLQQDTATT